MRDIDDWVFVRNVEFIEFMDEYQVGAALGDALPVWCILSTIMRHTLYTYCIGGSHNSSHDLV